MQGLRERRVTAQYDDASFGAHAANDEGANVSHALHYGPPTEAAASSDHPCWGRTKPTPGLAATVNDAVTADIAVEPTVRVEATIVHAPSPKHHANIVPWQQVCAEKGARLLVAPVDDDGQILLDEYERSLGPKTRLVALTQVSNALGTITPAHEMVKLARRHGAKVLVDGAQAVSHLRTDVQALDCDFFVFSGHKVFAPTGIGAVFGRGEVLEAMPTWQGGGNMIADVTFEKTVFQPAPSRFEAGTGNIADAVGLGAALDWLMHLGVETVARYEHDLLGYATEQLLTVPGLKLYGTAPDKAGVLSFTLAGQKTEQLSAVLDQDGIAVRSGHHCAQPILRRLGVEATVRASLAPYNTHEDIDALVAALRRLQERP